MASRPLQRQVSADAAMAAAPPWTVVPSISPSATTLNDVSARTATDAWAVGQFQGTGDDAGLQILAERWGASTTFIAHHTP